ncbi:FKBP-type peptidylprolyl isomerase [Nitritalea halalkaliphila LW7]|uniref:Peptidyl-prolyl cis-trans isomerase n=1 Tax=Nitritalea halalkaliphila LW7 TaxID=1189621 RepID=I5BZ57_9BACT|nr:FKBP-type peptidyl-prolyl cis-trans isomerase [Nitritalea halalkaliphila]EIM74859.1 FKBP-type peptidylprolyl isomerase [Nitritalea halalkaliphila LW7]
MIQVGPETVVAVSYTLHVDDGETGMQFREAISEAEPFYFLFGVGQVLPKLEAALAGLVAGDPFEVFLSYEEAYGDYDPAKRVILPKHAFKEDGVKQRQLLRVGKVIPMQDEEGNRLRGEILKVDYKGVHMDFNSPLAGLDLQFSGRVVAVRKAEAEEIAHGHVHGPGGVQH